MFGLAFQEAADAMQLDAAALEVGFDRAVVAVPAAVAGQFAAELRMSFLKRLRPADAA